MDIETRNASLDTLAVTIHALHVSGKQMTLAVFRQLPVASAYNYDGSLSPLEHWGLVRYSIKDYGALWLVASRDGILFRCIVHYEYSEDAFLQPSRAESDLAKAKGRLADYVAWERADLEYEKERAAYQIRFDEWSLARGQWKAAAELLSEMKSIGVKLEANGDWLKYRGPTDRLTPELIGRLTGCKVELLAALTEQTDVEIACPLAEENPEMTWQERMRSSNARSEWINQWIDERFTIPPPERKPVQMPKVDLHASEKVQGNQEKYEYDVYEAEEALAKANLAATSKAELLQLPQLFIAV